MQVESAVELVRMDGAGRPESSAGLGSIKAARRKLEMVDVGLKRATESGERKRLWRQRPVEVGDDLYGCARRWRGIERVWTLGGVGVAEGLAGRLARRLRGPN